MQFAQNRARVRPMLQEPLPEPVDLKSVWRVDKWLPELHRNRVGHAEPWRGFRVNLLGEAIRRRNVNWPRMVCPFLRGRDVLDVGCGRSLYSVGFWFAGVRSYTGVDPVLDPDSSLLKDSRPLHGRFTESPWTPRRLEQMLPETRFVRGLTSDLPPGSDFDVLAMHNVTEHLMNIGESFAEFAALIRPGGRIVFRHPNYYCWGGHHMKPRTLGEMVPGDPEQAKYMDWHHVVPRADWPDKITKKQNRIRIGELRSLVERHFELELWQETRSTVAEGADRLTPDILKRCPGFEADELLTQSVICVGRRS
ncbi:MAG: SAM-dependent methyltransferase [Verrucomicrobia bacterium]|nr:MAG: SAM-dependent methyltransferase [Verrucomicrobiota bacterium]